MGSLGGAEGRFYSPQPGTHLYHETMDMGAAALQCNNIWTYFHKHQLLT